MDSQKEYQSQINAITARLEQAKSSHLLSEEEKTKQVANYEKKLQEIANQLEVIE